MERLRQQLAEGKQMLEQAHERERTLARELEMAQARSRQMAAEWELENDSLRRDVAKREAEAASLRRDAAYAAETLADAKAALDAATDRERQLRAELDDAAAALQRAERLRTEDARDARHERERLAAEHNKARKERDAAEASLQDAEQRVKDEQVKHRAYELQAKQAAVAAEGLQATIRELNAAKTKAEDDAERLHEQIRKVSDCCCFFFRLLFAIFYPLSDSQQLTAEKTNLESELCDAQQEIQHLQLDIEGVRRDRDTAKRYTNKKPKKPNYNHLPPPPLRRSHAALQRDVEGLMERIDVMREAAEKEEARNRRLDERCRVLEAELEDLRARLLAAEDAEHMADERAGAERARLQQLLEDSRAQSKHLQTSLDQVDEASGAALRRLQSVVSVADFHTQSDDPASAVCVFAVVAPFISIPSTTPHTQFHLLLSVIQQLMTEVEEARSNFRYVVVGSIFLIVPPTHRNQSARLRQLQLTIQASSADLSGLTTQVPKLLGSVAGSPRSAAARSPNLLSVSPARQSLSPVADAAVRHGAGLSWRELPEAAHAGGAPDTPVSPSVGGGLLPSQLQMDDGANTSASLSRLRPGSVAVAATASATTPRDPTGLSVRYSTAGAAAAGSYLSRIGAGGGGGGGGSHAGSVQRLSTRTSSPAGSRHGSVSATPVPISSGMQRALAIVRGGAPSSSRDRLF